MAHDLHNKVSAGVKIVANTGNLVADVVHVTWIGREINFPP